MIDNLADWWSRLIEWAFYRRPVLAGLLLVVSIATLVILISVVGGGGSTPPDEEPVGVAPTTTAPVITDTGPRQTYRTTDDPVLIASSFVRSWLLGRRADSTLLRRSWLDGVTQHTTAELAEGLRRTDTATIPEATIESRRPDVEGGIDTGGAIVTYDLTDGSSVVVTMIYNPETGQWLVSGIEPGQRG